MTDELPTPTSEEIENHPSALASDTAGSAGEGTEPNVVPGDMTAASAAGDLGQVLLASALANTHEPGAVVVDSELQLENDENSEDIITAATGATNPYGMVDTGGPVSPGPFFEKQENSILDAAVAEANAPNEARNGAQDHDQGGLDTPGETSNEAATLPAEYQAITMTDLTMTDLTMQDAAMYDIADEGISAEAAADFAADSAEISIDTPPDSITETPADSPTDDGYNDVRTAEEREVRRREKGKERSHSRPRLPSPEASVERLSNTRLARIRSASITQREVDGSVAADASDSSEGDVGGVLGHGLPEVVVRDFAFEPVDPRFRGDVPEGWVDSVHGALRLSQISDSNAKSSKYSWGFVTFHDGQDGDFDGDYEDASDVDDDATKTTPDSGESFVPGIYAALYDFAPELESEMKLTIGEVITVFSKECDGWVQAGRVVNGNFTGEVGLVPENYLARIQVGDQPEHASPDMGGIHGGSAGTTAGSHSGFGEASASGHGGSSGASAGGQGGAEASPVASPVVVPDAVPDSVI